MTSDGNQKTCLCFQPISCQALSQFQLPVSSDLYRPICYQFRMRHAYGLFLSQPITTLENVSYISLAQPELKKLWIISQTSYLTVAIISGQCQYSVHVNAEYAHEMTARERLRSVLVTSSVTRRKQRFSSVIGASSSVVIGWDKNSTVLRCKCNL